MLESMVPRRDKVTCIYLKVPGGKGNMQRLADGRVLPCPDVRAVLAANRVCKVYIGMDPDWV
jgi:hypothetical protein